MEKRKDSREKSLILCPLRLTGILPVTTARAGRDHSEQSVLCPPAGKQMK